MVTARTEAAMPVTEASRVALREHAAELRAIATTLDIERAALRDDAARGVPISVHAIPQVTEALELVVIAIRHLDPDKESPDAR